jgi:hypothetical protein
MTTIAGADRNTNGTPMPELATMQRRSLVVGASALVLAILGGVLNRSAFFQAYLLGYLFWTGIGVGCLGLLMLHHLVGGRWGFAIQRLLEAGVRTLPLMALLFLPILFGLQDLYPWARPEVMATDALLQFKQRYLNAPAFFGRAVFYFLIWIGAGTILTMLSARQDQGLDAGRLTRRLQVWSGPGLVVYGFAVTFAAVDWAMSLEPHWYSTIYGVVFLVGQGLLALAFVTRVAICLANRPPLQNVLGAGQLHDLGNLLLAFVMLWAYIAFSQYLIIWSGNLPEENHWYLHRMDHGWGVLAVILIVFHFVVPFLLLLSRITKRRAKILGVVATGILVVRFVDLFWLIVPALHSEGFHAHWLDLALPVGLGGLWLATFAAGLRRRPLLAEQDPRFAGLADAAHGAHG